MWKFLLTGGNIVVEAHDIFTETYRDVKRLEF